nr:hypothetical protein [Tanacetum cinerariifolium]
RLKKLEKRKWSRTYGLKRLYKVRLSARVESSEDEGLGEEDASKQGRIFDIDANEDIYLVNVHNDKDMFGVNDLDGDEASLRRVRTSIREMESKSDKDAWTDAIDCFKETKARLELNLSRLTQLENENFDVKELKDHSAIMDLCEED